MAVTTSALSLRKRLVLGDLVGVLRKHLRRAEQRQHRDGECDRLHGLAPFIVMSREKERALLRNSARTANAMARPDATSMR